MEPIDWKTIKEYEDILFDYCDGIAKITINRPQVYNAFRPQTNCEMLDAMSICRERSDIGVIILTGQFGQIGSRFNKSKDSPTPITHYDNFKPGRKISR